MDLIAVISQLKTYALVFEGRIAGAAEFTSEMMLAEVRPEAWPSAYVVPLGSSATENDSSNSLYQTVTERVGVAVLYDNSADRRGQSVSEQYSATEASIFSALLNWRGSDLGHAMRGFEFANSGIVKLDRARLFYQWEFVIHRLIDDSDGFQPDAPRLTQITMNDPIAFPGAPAPPASVLITRNP